MDANTFCLVLLLVGIVVVGSIVRLVVMIIKAIFRPSDLAGARENTTMTEPPAAAGEHERVTGTSATEALDRLRGLSIWWASSHRLVDYMARARREGGRPPGCRHPAQGGVGSRGNRRGSAVARAADCQERDLTPACAVTIAA
jgi:hypothetical protein